MVAVSTSAAGPAVLSCAMDSFLTAHMSISTLILTSIGIRANLFPGEGPSAHLEREGERWCHEKDLVGPHGGNCFSVREPGRRRSPCPAGSRPAAARGAA